jgi:hypothetical protein
MIYGLPIELGMTGAGLPDYILYPFIIGLIALMIYGHIVKRRF